MKTAIFAAIVTAATFAVSTASAATVADTNNITSTGQTIGFSAAATENAVGAGVLTIVLNGDFSSNYTTGEYADVVIDALGGSMRLAFTGGTNVVSNTISGVSFVSSTAVETYAYYDTVLEYTFDVSAAAMSTILADDVFSGQFQLGGDVNAYSQFDTDFVSASLSYDTAAAVPLPAGLPLLAGALGGLGYLRSRKAATTA